MSPALVRSEEEEEVARALAPVLVVDACRAAGRHRLRVSHVGEQLDRALIEADERPPGIGGFGVEVQDVLHAPDELRVQGRDAPLLLLPGLHLVFFSTRRTVSSEISRTTPSWTRRSARSCIVQQVRPSGAFVQANATRNASALPSSFGSAPGRGRSYKARSSPSVQKRCRVRCTVARLVWSASAICQSYAPSLALSRMWALRIARAGARPWPTRTRSRARSSSVRRTRYCC